MSQSWNGVAPLPLCDVEEAACLRLFSVSGSNEAWVGRFKLVFREMWVYRKAWGSVPW
jgi:hypothetical protein